MRRTGLIALDEGSCFAGVFLALVMLGGSQTFAQSSFRRGDANADDRVDISDPSRLLGYLFLGEPTSLDCLDAADANDDGRLDITDAIHTLTYLFLGGVVPTAPFEACGFDATPDDLGCLEFLPCAQGAHTTVIGVVVLPDGEPAPEASVVAVNLGKVKSALDGSFRLDITVAMDAPVGLVFRFELGSRRYSASLALQSLSRDAVVDIGVIRLMEEPRDLFPGRVFEAGLRPRVLAAGDFDDDDDIDLAIADSDSGRAFMLWNESAHSFSLPQPLPVGDGGSESDIATADLDGDSDLDLVVALEGRSTVSVLLNQGAGIFASGVEYDVDALPRSLTIADLDGDGDQDLVVGTSSGALATLLGRGDGSFDSAASMPMGQRVHYVAAADLDGDGDLDLAVAVGRSVAILTNDGDANLIEAARLEVGSDEGAEYVLSISDFTGDGAPDIIVGVGNSHYLTLLRNVGGGKLVVDNESNLIVAGPPTSLAAADLDGDGDVDLAVCNSATSTVQALFNRGDGFFAGQGSYGVQSPLGLVAADLDGDGSTDLAASTALGTVALLESLGDGTFLVRGQQPAARDIRYVVGSCSLEAVDLNGDGELDLVGTGPGVVSVLLNQGDSRYGPALGYEVEGAGRALAVADFDGDGVLDIAAACSGRYCAILLNHGDGSLAAPKTYPIPVGGQAAVAAADLDGDGDPDLGFLIDSAVVILRNTGTGAFNTLVSGDIYDVDCPITAIAAADLDSDGNVDFAVVCPGFRPFALLNAGTGSFALQAKTYTGVDYSSSLARPMDLDRDGDLDLAVRFSSRQDTFTNQIRMFLNDGHAGFGRAIDSTVNGNLGSFAVADFNGDGKPDIVTADTRPGSFTKEVSFLRNEGAGAFSVQAESAVGVAFSSLTPVDIDDDNDIDLVATDCHNTGMASVLLNQGAGSFAPQMEGEATTSNSYNVGVAPVSIAAGDLDGDGRMDLVAANSGGGTVSVLLNQGGGGLASEVSYDVGSVPESAVVGDLDEDGVPDIVVANRGSESLSVLLGHGDGTFADQVVDSVGPEPRAVAVSDLDGDGHSDLLVAFGALFLEEEPSDHAVAVLLGHGDGTFAEAVTYPVGADPLSLITADLDADGHPDVVATSGSSESVSILLNRGDGIFAEFVAYPVSALPSSVVAADFDGDGDVDLAVANRGSDAVSLLLNSGDGEFAPQALLNAGSEPSALSAADLDGDGDSDLIVANARSQTVWALLNGGDATFVEGRAFAAPSPRALVTSDINGDGAADIVVANVWFDTVSILLNQRLR